MRQYETAFLIAPNLEEEETEKIISQMAGIISRKKGKMVKEDRWGKKKLAYPISKFEEAFYVFFLYEGNPEIPSELERRFKQTEAILRFLTVKRETKPNVRRKKKVVPADKVATEFQETEEERVVEEVEEEKPVEEEVKKGKAKEKEDVGKEKIEEAEKDVKEKPSSFTEKEKKEK